MKKDNLSPLDLAYVKARKWKRLWWSSDKDGRERFKELRKNQTFGSINVIVWLWLWVVTICIKKSINGYKRPFLDSRNWYSIMINDGISKGWFDFRFNWAGHRCMKSYLSISIKKFTLFYLYFPHNASNILRLYQFPDKEWSESTPCLTILGKRVIKH